MSSSDPHGLWQKKRRLRAALGDLQEYSDAPPAVRRLATAAEEEIEIEENEKSTVGSGLNREITDGSTAPPTPLERQDTQKCPHEGFPMSGDEDSVWSMKREDTERMSIARLSDVQPPSSAGGLQRMHEIYSGSPAESPRLIPLISRARSSPSSSKISLIPACSQRRGRSEVFNGCPYRVSRRSYSFCCHCAQIFLSGPHLVEEKDDVLQRGQRSFDKSSGNSKNSNDTRENRTENTNSTTKYIARQPVLVFKTLGFLPPVMFASSYPQSTVQIRLKKLNREAPNSAKSDGKKEPAKMKSDVMSTAGHHRVKILALTGEEYPHCTKQRGSESVFSLSTPRRQSTSSLLHCSSALHPSRQTLLWSSGTQSQSQQQQSQSQQLHSRVFSCSRASSEKTGHSPTSSSTFRPWPSESIEWLQHQLMLQQSHPCNLPVFASVGAGGESGGGESHVGLLSARTSGKYAGNNSISSLLLTRTGSNIDTLPTCCDAPLEAFMDSSSVATSSITTLT
ncbi:hypothetical protein LSM04_000907 [Trypanosoma melophagium]|uniref:uncharacterized protein n=1 Tax=Trypanosoma melophagium TaxID=715481 RepID=UPI003519F179|nr:hypothetical protein LSM04_000907 [Trypanosoma melophagium]